MPPRSVGLELVPGVEISGLVALSSDPRARTLDRSGLGAAACALSDQAERRRVRMRKICAGLSGWGSRAKRCSRRSRPIPDCRPVRTSRPRWLREATSSAPTTRSAYLGAGARRTSPPEWPALAEVVGWIRGPAVRFPGAPGPLRPVGGRAAALSGRLYRGRRRRSKWSTGGNGAQHAEACAMLAVKFGLLGSVGSDFHGPRLTWNPLGRLAKLPDCVVPVWRSHA